MPRRGKLKRPLKVPVDGAIQYRSIREEVLEASHDEVVIAVALNRYGQEVDRVEITRNAEEEESSHGG